jgi:hypothetical protein
VKKNPRKTRGRGRPRQNTCVTKPRNVTATRQQWRLPNSHTPPQRRWDCRRSEGAGALGLARRPQVVEANDVAAVGDPLVHVAEATREKQISGATAYQNRGVWCDALVLRFAVRKACGRGLGDRGIRSSYLHALVDDAHRLLDFCAMCSRPRRRLFASQRRTVRWCPGRKAVGKRQSAIDGRNAKTMIV